MQTRSKFCWVARTRFGYFYRRTFRRLHDCKLQCFRSVACMWSYWCGDLSSLLFWDRNREKSGHETCWESGDFRRCNLNFYRFGNIYYQLVLKAIQRHILKQESYNTLVFFIAKRLPKKKNCKKNRSTVDFLKSM